MASDLDDLADPERRLCEILAGYFEAVQAGQAPDREAWLASHPALAGQLTKFLEEQDRLLQVTAPLRSLVNGNAGLPSTRASVGSARSRGSSGERTDVDSSTSTGHLFGDYELLGEPTHGGMSFVYRALAAEPESSRGPQDTAWRDAGR